MGRGRGRIQPGPLRLAEHGTHFGAMAGRVGCGVASASSGMGLGLVPVVGEPAVQEIVVGIAVSWSGPAVVTCSRHRTGQLSAF